MAVPMLDLTRLPADLERQLEDAALRVLRSGRFILGPEGEALESELSRYLGARQVIGLSSGTDALLAALMALEIGPGDRVAVPVYSFFATAGVVARLGARPVFVDVEPTWGNMDPAALERTLAAWPDLKAVVFVHLYGAAEGIAEVAELAQRHGVPLIEDAAQAIGTRSAGRPAGRFGLCACFSTFPTKNLGGTGDGGFLCTDDDALGDKVRRLRHHGQTGPYEHAFVGGNFRLDELQAACLRVKLPHVDRFNAARRRHAERYRQALADRLGEAVQPPADVADRHVYHQFVTLLEAGRRDATRAALAERGIATGVYYPLPFHRQPCFGDVPVPPQGYPVADDLARRNLALPIFPELRDSEIDQVVDALASALATVS